MRAPHFCQVILYISPHNTPPPTHLRRMIGLDTFFSRNTCVSPALSYVEGPVLSYVEGPRPAAGIKELTVDARRLTQIKFSSPVSSFWFLTS